MQGTSPGELAGASQKVAVKDALCPNCGASVDKREARKKWFFSVSRKPVACTKCGAEYIPVQPPSPQEGVLAIGVLGLSFFIGIPIGRSLDIPGWESFLELIGFVLVLIPSFLVFSVFLWFAFDHINVALRLVPNGSEPAPENLSPLISKNDDGTFTVKGRTYKSWKSAVAYLEMLDRSPDPRGGS